jgi:hypothetical protein
MKNKYVISKFFAGLCVMALSAVTLNAQNYKAAAIDASGKVTDNKDQHLGWVTAEGTVKDTSGVEIAHVDDKGNLVNAKNGKVLGKAEKNGTFVFHFNNKTKEKLVTSPPMNGTCEVKDHAGKTVLLVHENYKNYGACAYHCLTMKKEHKAMKMK